MSDIEAGGLSEDHQASPEPEPMAVRALVARNLLRLRLDGRASHGEVAQAAARFGLKWTPQWVSGVERGQRDVNGEQLIALPMVLSDVLKHPVGLADLLVGDEPLVFGTAVNPAVPFGSAQLRETVTAPPYFRAFGSAGAPTTPAEQSPPMQAAAKMREITAAGLGNVDVRALSRAEEGAGEFEERLARKLGVAPIVVIAAAASLWGRSAGDERDARMRSVVAEDAPKPATVTRKLTNDLTQRIADAAAPPEDEVEEDAVVTAINEATVDVPVVAPRPRADPRAAAGTPSEWTEHRWRPDDGPAAHEPDRRPEPAADRPDPREAAAPEIPRPRAPVRPVIISGPGE